MFVSLKDQNLANGSDGARLSIIKLLYAHRMNYLYFVMLQNRVLNSLEIK